ncbi:MAG: alpha/beta hydrolase [Paracoccaceae bacterium]|nr:alpha/beta hydrolase [Paracoccaceae bacterium]
MGAAWQDGGEFWLEISGQRLEGICFGPAPDAAPTIVMLHEGLGCVALWRDFPERLAKATGYGIFAWSRAGYGQSDRTALPRPLDYMTREAIEALPQVLDQIGFRRGILLGHSDGASIAAIYAGGVQDHRIRGLMLIAPHFFTEPSGLAAIAEARDAFEAGDLRARMAKYHRDPENAFWGWNDAWLDPGFADWNIADAIDYWRVPVLAIQGTEDRYGTRAQIAEIESRIYAPLDVALIEGCGHSPHAEAPDRTLAEVADFTKRLNRIEGAAVALP